METMIINQQNKINYTKEMQQVILNVANAVAKMVKLSPNTELSVMIVDNNYIKELNLIYRGENIPTDVLSFAMNELSEEEMELDLPGEVNVLGDIVVSLEKAASQSEDYGHSVERELGYLIAHGMLHLLGYDHENEEERNLMRNLEEKIMHKVKLER
ncbi:MAG: rRNA maturation RNase YbeY [Syntrophomonas sp.]|uniref:rRNA maturation RNase YbeY n=1 Tax=Syntrophomonas sp. TaxID=2053627 RepID=UPI0026093807|nr:rRNA maturation RNase YbeY [Syntrophomonas sp.]MDD2510885.1 rRNA maturation RNase YbeY [Syntrophomonas sp.]MDD3879785.1 rRNA maturation RNase YbeY [Syntrophomonas sp.]MDD4625955.1 rRNA maturation RNase YbeY [Syntrophomonas sp.]